MPSLEEQNISLCMCNSAFNSSQAFRMKAFLTIPAQTDFHSVCFSTFQSIFLPVTNLN
jgi:hypothetical protein